MPMPAPIPNPRALGVLLCYNDADILPDAIEALLNNRHDLIVWDHGSDDGTAAVLDRYASAFLERKFIPRSFDFYKLYGEMSKNLIRNHIRHYDWISWPDQDEILEGPAREESYYQWLTKVVNSPYNWVRFHNFNYWLTGEDDSKEVSPVKRIRRYCLFADCSPRIRAWRASVTNERKFNHNPLDGARYPRLFNLKHYPMRSHEQMLRRLTKDRVNLQRGTANYHYNNMKDRADGLTIAAHLLHQDDGHTDLNPQIVYDWRSIYGHAPTG